MKALVVGKGRMGSLIGQTMESLGHSVVGYADALDLSVLDSMEVADVVLDFSHRDNLEWVLDYTKKNKAALVYGTTGLTEQQKEQLLESGKEIPLFYSANYSYGVAVLQKTLSLMVPLLKERYDMELVETHHNQKADAPSGTAKAILAISNASNHFEEVYGREGMCRARKKEIGVHALRGGTEAGQHSVHFFGDNESITITHHATNRQIFVNGACQAAEFIVNQEPGVYAMNDLIDQMEGE